MTFTATQDRSLAAVPPDVPRYWPLLPVYEGESVWYHRPGKPSVRAEVTCIWDDESGRVNLKFWDAHCNEYGKSLCIDIDVLPFEASGQPGWSREPSYGPI